MNEALDLLTHAVDAFIFVFTALALILEAWMMVHPMSFWIVFSLVAIVGLLLNQRTHS